jgi:hypothetical protein
MDRRARSAVIGVFCVGVAAGCAGELPPPQTRSVIIYSGERIMASPERMAEVEAWLRPQLEEIELNPDFLIRVIQEDLARYPWDALEVVADTADIRIASSALDAETPYMIYAHLRLMQERGTLAEWVPEAEDAGAYETEEAIVSRVADVWLLGRSVFDTQPFGPMDELLYAKEFGYLEDFLLATQADRFPEALEDYREGNPENEEVFRNWFGQTFEREGPGFLPQPGDAPEETPTDRVTAPS